MVQVSWLEQMRSDIDRLMVDQQSQFRRLTAELRSDMSGMLREAAITSNPSHDLLIAEHRKTQDMIQGQTRTLLQAVDSLRAMAASTLRPGTRETSKTSMSSDSEHSCASIAVEGSAQQVCFGDSGETTVGAELAQLALGPRRPCRGPGPVLRCAQSLRLDIPSVKSSQTIDDGGAPAAHGEDIQNKVAVKESACVPVEMLSQLQADGSSSLSQYDDTMDSWERDRVLYLSTTTTQGDEHLWEWKRIDGQWAPYTESEMRRIERAFWSGKSIVYIKSDREGQPPLEIFFADMVQYNPDTCHVWKIRRTGSIDLTFARHPWMLTCRHLSAIYSELRTGSPRFETLQEHRLRKDKLCTTSVQGLSWKRQMVKMTSSSSSKFTCLAMLVRSRKFECVSIAFTVLQMIWVLAFMDASGTTSVDLYDQDFAYIVGELFFCLFFVAELFVRYFAVRSTIECLRDPWFSFDLVCATFSVIEVIVLPPLSVVGAPLPVEARTLRVFRIGRLFRFFRLLRHFNDLNVLITAFLDGLTSAAYIWVLGVIMLFAFAVILVASIEAEELKELFFSTLSHSMMTLLLSGLLLDNLTFLWNAFLEAGERVPLMFFVGFMLVAYFGLLNMLIGSFCHTAIRVANEYADETRLHCLESALHGVLEVYHENSDASSKRDQVISKGEFRILMGNVELLETLGRCGTDLSALPLLEDVLFSSEEKTISLDQLVTVILRLRAGAPAHVSHMVSFQTLLQRRLSDVEQLIGRLKGGRGALPDELCDSGSCTE